MSDDTIQLLAAVALGLIQIYAVEPWKFHIFARFWDWLARVSGALANTLAWMSINARHNYFISLAETA